MTFRFNNLNYNLTDLSRRFGYHVIAETDRGELNCVRPLQGQNYPRFHIYMSETKEIVTLNIHLDQKKPVYDGQTAHSGDYDSEVVKEEMERIKNILWEK